MKRTPLYDYHLANGYLGEYAGFEMPMWYKGAVSEYLSVRNTCGVFDVSHMGRLFVTGKEATNFLDYILTSSCTDLNLLIARQAFLCNYEGGIIDDIMLFRLEQEKFLLIVNAINIRKDTQWLEKNVSHFDVKIEDITSEVPMIAIQGPNAIRVLQSLTETDLSTVLRLHAAWIKLYDKVVFVSRTGYSGEDGFEIYIFQEKRGEFVVKLWNRVLEVGGILGIEPCGLVARDTLRLEAGLCLNGNELDEKTSPIEAGLKYAVHLNERHFIGKESLLKQLEKGISKVRIGFKIIGKGVPRKGMEIMADDEKIGFVTSGTFSPLLKLGIGMGYVSPDFSEIDLEIEIMIRKRLIRAKIVKLPFYDEGSYGWRRSTK